MPCDMDLILKAISAYPVNIIIGQDEAIRNISITSSLPFLSGKEMSNKIMSNGMSVANKISDVCLKLTACTIIGSKSSSVKKSFTIVKSPGLSSTIKILYCLLSFIIGTDYFSGQLNNGHPEIFDGGTYLKKLIYIYRLCNKAVGKIVIAQINIFLRRRSGKHDYRNMF